MFCKNTTKLKTNFLNQKKPNEKLKNRGKENLPRLKIFSKKLKKIIKIAEKAQLNMVFLIIFSFFLKNKIFKNENIKLKTIPPKRKINKQFS